MIEDRDLLDRALRQFPSEPGVVERVMRHRDRKRRNQRIAATVVAVAVFVAAMGGLISVFSRHRRAQPASGQISVSNVATLKLAWVGKVAGKLGTPVVSDSTVFVSGSDHASSRGTLYAFPTDCPTSSCTASWTAEIAGTPDTPAVADGVVYVAGGGRSSGSLYAFSTTCGSGGAVCRPLWTAPIGGAISSNDLGPLVDAGLGNVYIGSSDRRIYVFPVGCRDDGGICTPSWSTRVRLTPTSWVVSVDRLFVGTASGDLGTEMFSGLRRGILYAFACSSTSPACRAVHAWSHLGRIWDLTAANGFVYVGTDAGFTSAGPGLYQIQADCGEPTCDPRWHASTTCCTRVTVSGNMVFAHDEKTALYAFPTECGDHGSTCEPTWKSIVVNPLYFGTPVVSNGLVFIGSGSDGTVSALPVDCVADCMPLWTRFAGDAVKGVAVADGKLFAASNGLYVFTPRLQGAGRSDNGHRSAAVFYAVLLLAALGFVLTRRALRSRASHDVG
jgi:hypothetical protein